MLSIQFLFIVNVNENSRRFIELGLTGSRWITRIILIEFRISNLYLYLLRYVFFDIEKVYHKLYNITQAQ